MGKQGWFSTFSNPKIKVSRMLINELYFTMERPVLTFVHGKVDRRIFRLTANMNIVEYLGVSNDGNISSLRGAIASLEKRRVEEKIPVETSEPNRVPPTLPTTPFSHVLTTTPIEGLYDSCHQGCQWECHLLDRLTMSRQRFSVQGSLL